MTEGPQQRRYACDDPVVMGVYGPGEKVMSGRTVIRDLQTYHPIQPHTPFFIQRTMGPSGHVGVGGRGDSTSCEVRVILDQHSMLCNLTVQSNRTHAQWVPGEVLRKVTTLTKLRKKTDSVLRYHAYFVK